MSTNQQMHEYFVVLVLKDKESTKQSKEAKGRGGMGHQPQKQNNISRQYKHRYTINLHMHPFQA